MCNSNVILQLITFGIIIMTTHTFCSGKIHGDIFGLKINTNSGDAMHFSCEFTVVTIYSSE